MAINTAGSKVYYAPETVANVRPTTGWKQKAANTPLNICDYVSSISGFAADRNKIDVTALSAIDRHQFIAGLMNNDGTISLNAFVDNNGLTSWQAIVDEYESLSDGLSLWFEFVLPGLDQGYFLRGEPLPMVFPDIEVDGAAQTNVQIIESNCLGWDDVAIS